jgi:hypothetical protein
MEEITSKQTMQVMMEDFINKINMDKERIMVKIMISNIMEIIIMMITKIIIRMVDMIIIMHHRILILRFLKYFHRVISIIKKTQILNKNKKVNNQIKNIRKIQMIKMKISPLQHLCKNKK